MLPENLVHKFSAENARYREIHPVESVVTRFNVLETETQYSLMHSCFTIIEMSFIYMFYDRIIDIAGSQVLNHPSRLISSASRVLPAASRVLPPLTSYEESGNTCYQ